jgi:gamma-butyrobetaine dioxygenase
LDNDPVHRARNGQRLIDITDLPQHPAIELAALQDGVLRLEWAGRPSSSLPVDWLFLHCPCPAHSQSAPPALWSVSHLGILHRFAYAAVRDDEATRLAWLETAASRGVAFLEGVPPEEGRVVEIAAWVGWIRETNYGRVFDVRTVPDPNNLADSSLALGLHTDNPYRDPVPGLQILHCLCAGDGGESIFADGFSVARALREEDANAFQILASTPVRFRFSDAVADLSAQRPLLQLDSNGDVEAVHYNNRSIAPLRLAHEKMLSYYAAYRTLARLLADPRFVIKTFLVPGELVLFNNRRVLHGRTGFSSAVPRLLQGCYLDQDGLWSNIAVLKRHGHR